MRAYGAENSVMDFEWDEKKALVTARERGLTFEIAAAVLLSGNLLVKQDKRRDYGEDRYQAIGRYDGREIVVVYTFRGDRTRIISARKAHDNEQRAYRSVFGIPGGARPH